MSRPVLRLLIAQAADALTFALFMLTVSGASQHAERNPLVAGVMALGGVQAVVIVKVGVAAVVGWRADHSPAVSSHYRNCRTVALSVAAASGIVGAGFNLAAVVRP